MTVAPATVVVVVETVAPATVVESVVGMVSGSTTSSRGMVFSFLSTQRTVAPATIVVETVTGKQDVLKAFDSVFDEI